MEKSVDYRVFIGLLACLLLPALLQEGHAQAAGAIEGVVRLPTEQPAHGVDVLLVELNRVVETDDDGRYRFEDVPQGTYDVVAIMNMLDSETHRVRITAGTTQIQDIRLRISPLRTEITVTARGLEETTFQAVQSVTSLDAFDLSKTMSPSIGEVLDGQLGVAKRSFGTGSARPVIRGFDGDRVLVLQDGMSVGSLASQSGDHGEPIDASTLERIEIVRGPATLLYGSNAVGGVVNALSGHQATHDLAMGLRGQVSSVFGSVNGQAGGNVNAEYGFNNNWLFWFGGGGQRTGDYDTPIGSVDNSKSRVRNGSAGLGWFGARGFASADYQANGGRYGIPFAAEFHAGDDDEDHVDEELEAVDVDFRRHNLRLSGGVHNLSQAFDDFRFSLNYSDWNHKELEIFHDGDEHAATTFDNRQFSYRGVFEQTRRGVFDGRFGIMGSVRQYRVAGEEALSPPVDQNTFAAFALEELHFDRVRLQMGGRLETTRYRPVGLIERHDRDHDDDGLDQSFELVQLPNRTFTGFSGGIGARFGLWRAGAFVANYTNSFRAPALEELYNFGPHTGNLAFEIGNPNLRRERSNGFDFSLRHQHERARAEANFFYYDFDGFVFLSPTGNIEHGLAEADYAHGDARFAGSELKLDVGLHQHLWLNLAMDVVDTKLRETGGPLPRIPPMRSRIGLDFRHAGLSVQPEIVMADSRENVFATETPTAGYGVFNLAASYTVPQEHFSHHFSLNFHNVGDRLYRNHISFIKDRAPEIGRGIRFSYVVKFF